MRRIVSLITASALLLHVWLGCCAHHVHADQSPPNALDPHGHAAGAHDHSHGHAHPAADSESSQHRADPSDDCQEGDCAFLVAGKTVVIFDVLVAPLPEFASDARIESAASSSVQAIDDPDDRQRLPVRLHLLHQLLLI
jgi:hypothetical protein